MYSLICYANAVLPHQKPDNIDETAVFAALQTKESRQVCIMEFIISLVSIVDEKRRSKTSLAAHSSFACPFSSKRKMHKFVLIGVHVASMKRCTHKK